MTQNIPTSLPGPVGILVRGVEIGFEFSLRDPSVTKGTAGTCSELQPRCHDVTRRAQRGGGGAQLSLPPPHGAGEKAVWRRAKGHTSVVGVATRAFVETLNSEL